ncbi:hypothetical protein ISS05_00570 [Candidatus Woesearchaeota archaeon]|nr:hypothetical protein [Candidatus Woesearchaeota archaeon]
MTDLTVDMKKFLLVLFVFLLMTEVVLGANIHGNIYDFSLDRIGNVIIEINTAPKQFFVSKNGTYSFTVPIGVYEVKAQHYESTLLISSTSENITVQDNGDYILDLVLFPVINEEELLEDEIEVSKNRFNIGSFSVVLIILAGILFYFYNKKKSVKKREVIEKEDSFEEKAEEITKGGEDEKEEKKERYDFYLENLAEKVIEMIKEEGGRTTQKEIRKKIPLSEAKISLVIAELEANGRIRKIKKGRGNILILR